MKLFKSFAIAIVSVMFLASCATTMPYAVTDNPVGSKVGKSSNTCIFPVGGVVSNASSSGLCFNNKEYGIYEAAKSAGIEKVGAVDLKTEYKIFFRKYTLIVYGE